MGASNRWLGNLRFFLAMTVLSLLVLPFVLAALAYYSRQAMFWPAYESLYTYFLPYTVAASASLGLLALVLRVIVRSIRKFRKRNSG